MVWTRLFFLFSDNPVIDTITDTQPQAGLTRLGTDDNPNT
jgi:hypothetical protein